jgi:hypothetical protein
MTPNKEHIFLPAKTFAIQGCEVPADSCCKGGVGTKRPMALLELEPRVESDSQQSGSAKRP